MAPIGGEASAQSLPEVTSLHSAVLPPPLIETPIIPNSSMHTRHRLAPNIRVCATDTQHGHTDKHLRSARPDTRSAPTKQHARVHRPNRGGTMDVPSFPKRTALLTSLLGSCSKGWGKWLSSAAFSPQFPSALLISASPVTPGPSYFLELAEASLAGKSPGVFLSTFGKMPFPLVLAVFLS